MKKVFQIAVFNTTKTPGKRDVHLAMKDESGVTHVKETRVFVDENESIPMHAVIGLLTEIINYVNE